MTDRDHTRKGRGALSNPEGRFESRRIDKLEDGFSDDDAGELPPLETTVMAEHARSILTRNDSPDVGFDASINPYRGCEHGCVYCMSGETEVLLPDGSSRALATLAVGDEICGTARLGHYRRFVRTRVLAHWRTQKQAFRITLADGTILVASADHRFLTERGWKFVDSGGDGQRPRLTTSNSLLGIGASTGDPWRRQRASESADFRKGYLSGIVRGDALLRSYVYDRRERGQETQYRFRLALADFEPLDRAAEYLSGNWAYRTERACSARRSPAEDEWTQIRDLVNVHTSKRSNA